MKKNLLFLLFIGLNSFIAADDSAVQYGMAFNQNGDSQFFAAQEIRQEYYLSERAARHELYYNDIHNPHHYKLKDFNFDYSIAIIQDHIKVLENKVLEGKTYLDSRGLRIGSVIACFSAFMGYNSYKCHTRGDEGFLGLGIMAGVLATGAGIQFYKVSRYAERLIERLQRDRRILAKLYEEKAISEKSKLDYVNQAAVNAVAGVVAAIANVITPNESDAAQENSRAESASVIENSTLTI